MARRSTKKGSGGTVVAIEPATARGKVGQEAEHRLQKLQGGLHPV